MASAGYLSTIYKPGTATTMTAEAMNLVSGKTYRITDDAKRVIDPTAAITVLDNAVPVTLATDVEDIDLLMGKVTFAASYTPTGPITITTDYLPMSAITCGRSFTFSASRDLADTTCFNSTGVRSKKALLKDCSVTIDQLEDVPGGEFATEFAAGTPVILVIGPGNDPLAADVVHIAARVLIESDELSAGFDGLVESSLSAQCDAVESVDGYDVSFSIDV